MIVVDTDILSALAKIGMGSAEATLRAILGE